MNKTHAHCIQQAYLNESSEFEFIRALKDEFSVRYNIDLSVASDMAIDLAAALSLTNCDLNEVKSYLTL